MSGKERELDAALSRASQCDALSDEDRETLRWARNVRITAGVTYSLAKWLVAIAAAAALLKGFKWES